MPLSALQQFNTRVDTLVNQMKQFEESFRRQQVQFARVEAETAEKASIAELHRLQDEFVERIEPRFVLDKTFRELQSQLRPTLDEFQSTFTRYSTEHLQSLATIQRFDELLSMKADKHKFAEVFKQLKDEYATMDWVKTFQSGNT